MDIKQLLEELSNVHGAPGFEQQVLEVVHQYTGDLPFVSDHMNNGYLNLTTMDDSKPTVMLDSHLDEVGFMVSYITSAGQIGMQPLGGWVPASVQSQKFKILNNRGEYVSAVSSSKPPHFLTATEKQQALKMEDLKLDVGATSKEEVIEDFGIEVVQPVTPDVQFEFNEQNDVMLGKAFDNRLGVGVVLAVFDHLEDELNDLPFNLVGSFASQEEVGLRGAKITSRRINPQMAIVVEATPSDDFAKPKEIAQGQLGSGPQLRYRDSTYIASPRLNQKIVSTAQEEGIALQQAVRSGGGTNAGSIYANEFGVEVATLGVPTRYAHTHHLFASYRDWQATVQLIVAFLHQLKEEDFTPYHLKKW